MIEYQFEDALEQLEEVHSLKNNLDETNKAFDYIKKCSFVQGIGDLQKAKELFSEISRYYRMEADWLANFERPFLGSGQNTTQKNDFWYLFGLLKCMIPFYCLLRIGESELVKALIKVQIT